MTRKWAAWIVGLLVFAAAESLFLTILKEMRVRNDAMLPAVPFFLISIIVASWAGRWIWFDRLDGDLTVSQQIGIAAWLLGLGAIAIVAVFLELQLERAPVTRTTIVGAAAVSAFVIVRRWWRRKIEDAEQQGHDVHRRPSTATGQLPLS